MLALCRRVSPSGLDLFRPYHLALLARLQARAGLPEEGLELLQDAFDIVAPFELHWCEAEVHRQRGELLRALGDDGRESEACFRTALALAERQGARAWALRAATSLARLEQDRGRPRAGREVLAAVYDGFTEGLDTRDLCVAKALLDGRAVTDPGT